MGVIVIGKFIGDSSYISQCLEGKDLADTVAVAALLGLGGLPRPLKVCGLLISLLVEGLTLIKILCCEM
jgi:hypothetical protein